MLSDPVILPGDAVPASAAGVKEQPRIAKGADSYLAVWTDSRTLLANEGSFTNIGFSGPYGGTGMGSMKDIYAARVGGDGQVIDTTPIIVSQAGYNQGYPRVGWNGQNWLVTWFSQHELDTNLYEIRAARVSSAGQLLDTTSILLKSEVGFGEFPTNVVSDLNGNWVVIWEGFSGGSSRSVFAARVTPAGTLLDVKEIYQHSSQYLSDPDIARAGDRFLLTYNSNGPIMGVLLDANLNQLRAGPEMLSNGGSRPRLASDGTNWLVVIGGIGVNAIFVSHDGDPVNLVTVTNDVRSAPVEPQVCWDGSNWVVAYDTNYNEPANTNTVLGSDLYAKRLSSAGVVLDPTGIAVRTTAGSQVSASITPSIQGGAQVAWQEQDRDDVRGASISATGTVSSDVSLEMGAPRQTKVRTATNGTGFLTVFRSDSLGVSRILAQHLDVNGTPIGLQPFLIAEGSKHNNPSVAWNGSDYLVVWEVTTETGKQSFGRLVPAVGIPLLPEFLIMNGEMPDAAGLNGAFLVVNIIQETSQIRRTQFVRVSGTGAAVGAPVKFSVGGAFNHSPRAAAFGNRWLAVWEARSSHNSSTANTWGSFIEPDGTSSTPIQLGNDGNPELAVAGSTGQALLVTGKTAVRARRLNTDGTSPEPLRGMLVSASTALNGKPSVTWNGNQYIVTWIDHRNEPGTQQAKGDIYAARVAHTNVTLEEFPVANSGLPEETPFVISANGLTLFSYAKFYGNPAETPSLAAHRTTMRYARFGAPDLGTLPNAPSNLHAQMAGVLTLTWNDNSNDEAGFKVESRNGLGPWSQIRELGANVTSLAGLTVSATEPTSFRVRAYDAAGDSGYSNEASAPLVSLAQFTPNTYLEPATVQISGTASDPEGVAQVEFYYSTDATYPNYTLLNTDNVAPYAFTWPNINAGYYYVKAKAIDAQGSSAESDDQSFVVYGNPTAQITNPVNEAIFAAGANITINANAQARNSNDYLLRADFYANTTLIGSVTGHYASYSFTWNNAPTGSYAITVRPVSNLGLTGTSAPINITVGNPGPNISGRITDGTKGIYNATVTLSGSQAAVVRTDPDGNYFFTNVSTGSNVTVTPSALGFSFTPPSRSFNNLVASQTANFTGVPGPTITPDPSAIPIYSQPVSSNLQVSSKQVAGYLRDEEAADDFNVSGAITRVVVRGGRDFNTAPNPGVRGAFLRFFDGSASLPGAQVAEYYFPVGSPNLKVDPDAATSPRYHAPDALQC